MNEITDKHERRARPAQLDLTDEQCICCPKCRGAEVESLDDFTLWGVSKSWECKACRIVFEVRQIARELGPVTAWL
jgi:hypothetical protein